MLSSLSLKGLFYATLSITDIVIDTEKNVSVSGSVSMFGEAGE